MRTSTKVWIGVGAFAAAVLTTIGIVEEVKHKKKSSQGPTNPVWKTVAPAADGSFPFQPGQTYAVSMLDNPGTGANVAQVTKDLTAASVAGSISPTVGLFPAPSGQPAPAGWPAGDQAGNLGARWSFVPMGAGYTLPGSDAAGVSVWILTGYT